MASRKDALIKATATNTEVKPHSKEEALDDLDLAEHQAEVLTPSHTEIETFDGKSYFLPNEFTLRDVFRNRVENALLGFVNVANFELSKLGASFGSEHLTFDAIAAMLLKRRRRTR